MLDYGDMLAFRSAEGYSGPEARELVDNAVQPEAEEDDEPHGCTCPMSQEHCTC